jgi:methylated-DNA-protein-cysteine methyltransferase related protein
MVVYAAARPKRETGPHGLTAPPVPPTIARAFGARSVAVLRPTKPAAGSGLHDRIYAVVARIPRGRVVAYGQIACAVDGATARLVGYAMAAVPFWLDIPWHRVINSRGEVSPRARGEGHVSQRRLLEKEGVEFDARGRVDMERYRWTITRAAPRRKR